MNRVLRVLGAAALVLASVPFLLLGVLSIQRESNIRELHPYEREVIGHAVRYIGDHLRATGGYPSETAFRAWAMDAGYVTRAEATSRLPPQWTVFDYNPPAAGRTDYSFRIWDGDCNSDWHSEPDGNTRFTVDPACYFLLGSRPADLVALFGAVALLLAIAGLIARPRPSKAEH